ncbi:MAG: hypothetical protein IPP47_22040 [Bryobacterales bacterium]|nr:hypothetical protein [Bryobacterales bacterium]
MVKNPERKQLLPDFVAVIQEGFMLTRMKHDPEKQKLVVTTPGADFDFYAGIRTADDTLAFFLLTLDCCLNVARLRNVELQDHWSILATAFQDDLIFR